MHSHRRAPGRRTLFSVVALVAVSLAVPVAASARDWQDGDVFVGLTTGAYHVYDNGGTLREPDLPQGSPGFAVDCAFDRAGVLHTTNFTNSLIVRFTLPHPHTKLTNVATGPLPESVSFARDGTYYVGHQVNPSSIRKFSGAGGPLGTFSPANPAAMLDLSANQRTMFYTSRSGANQTQVHRFDVGNNTNLPDFANLGGTNRTADLKLLPPGDGSGGLIVAQTTNIKRVNGNGAVVQTYDVPGQDSWFGIALDPDGRSFWAQTSLPGSVFRFNIASGAVDRGPLASAANAFGICVKGTRTAALDNAAPSIAIAAPANGATVQQGQVVAAAYSCADDANGTGIQTCSGPVPAGSPIDTGSIGPKTFTVTASDVAGNTATASTTYTVVAPPPPPPPPPDVERIVVSLSFDFKAFRRFTKLTRLQVKRVPRGSTVKATCALKKRKCPAKARKSFAKRRARGTVSLNRRYKGVKLRVGTKITVTVTKPGAIGAVKILEMRSRKPPKVIDRCLPPGGQRHKKRC
jgi:hypothetical protein